MALEILQIENGCTGCGSCANICPKHCLHLEPNEEGFFYPVFDGSECIHCRLCEKACHVLQSEEHPTPNPEHFFIYHSNDESVLEASSSGGGFSLFAEWVLAQRGVVFGSRYNSKNERLEVFSTEISSLASLRKSKYLESFTGDSFSDIRRLLIEGRRVLYCGTPCQVRGLKQFLSATHTNTDFLLTIDFACHGVPSNEYFNCFKHMFERHGKKVITADFRHKNFLKSNMMWHNMTMRLVFSDGTEKIFPRYSYYYYYYEPFLDSLFLRKSCYLCDIALHSDADITLGDFWGISKYRSELDDNKGMSFISVNNDKYLSLWYELSRQGFSEHLPFKEISYQYEDKRNKRAKQLVFRDQFTEQIRKIGYRKAVINHYGRLNMFKSIYLNRWKQLLKQLVK